MENKTKEISYFDVTGQSMWPFLRGVERVVVRPTPISALRRGDLIVFRWEGKVVCHRFAGKDKERLSARPDTAWQRSEIFSSSDLLGRVVGIAHKDKLRPWTGLGARCADLFFFWCGPCFQILR